MPLTCELGWHRADPLARWNDGYYFSKCTRCGRDLVRTAYERWHVPKGYRVVWQAKPPEAHGPAPLVRKAPSAAAPSPAPELPIQEVLRHLESRDLTNDGGVGCEDEERHVPPLSAPEEVHVGRVRVAEFRVDQLLVSDVIRPAAAEAKDEEEPDPELPFQETSSGEDPAAETAPAVEEPVLQESEELSPQAEEEPVTEASPPVEGPELEQTETSSLPPAEPIRRSAFDDFMSDSTDADFWDLAPRPPEPQPASRIDTDTLEGENVLPGAAVTEMPVFKPVAEEDYQQETPGFQQLDDGVDSIAPLDDEAELEFHGAAKKAERPGFLSLFARRRETSGPDEQPPAETAGHRLSLSGQLAVASLVVAAGLTLASLTARSPSAPAPAPPRATPAPSPAAPAKPKAQPPALSASAVGTPARALFPARQKAFVTARILNCRASPVEQAGSVKKLSRGAEVEVLAREADWMSISHQGRQCWAAVRYISPDRPA